MQKCPRCKNETKYPRFDSQHCYVCHYAWTDSQQSIIDAQAKKLVDAAELHLADEQSVRNMTKRIEELTATLVSIKNHVHCDGARIPWPRLNSESKADTQWVLGHLSAHEECSSLADAGLKGLKP